MAHPSRFERHSDATKRAVWNGPDGAPIESPAMG